MKTKLKKMNKNKKKKPVT